MPAGQQPPRALGTDLNGVLPGARRGGHSLISSHPYVAADLVIGFNLAGFDLPVLAGESPPLGAWVLELPTLDLLQEIQAALGHRLSLDHLAEETLGRRKTGSGLEALELYRQRRWRKLERYCLEDVRITRDLYEHARRRGWLRYRDRRGRRRRVELRV